jgi:hypothetical protein
MPDGPSTSLDASFEQKLNAQESVVLSNYDDLVPHLLTYSARKKEEQAKNYENRFARLFNKKVQQTSRLFMQAQKHQLNTLSDEYWIEQHEIVLSALMERFALSTEIVGNKTVSTDKEMIALMEQALVVFEHTDVEALMNDKVTEKYILRDIIQKTPVDHLKLAEKLKSDATLTEADWTLLVNTFQEAMSNNELQNEGSKNNICVVQMLYMRGPKRIELMNRLIAADTEGMDRLIPFLVIVGALTKTQAKHVMQGKPAFAAAMVQLDDPKQEKARVKFEQKAQTRGTHYRRQMLHTNHARKLLSMQGALAAFGTLNGALTIAANLGIDIMAGTPENIPGNPALWMGIGMLGVGLEIDPSGLLPTKPSVLLAQMSQDTDEVAFEEQLALENALVKHIGAQPEAAQFYYNNTEKIIEAYTKKKKEGISHRGLTLEDLGIDYETLDPQFRPAHLPKKELESHISIWVRDMSRTKMGVGRSGNVAQRAFLNQACLSQGVPPFGAEKFKDKK